MGGKSAVVLMIIYQVASFVSFIYMTFFDGINYNWWNWIIIIPINGFLSEIWPLYWGLIRWVF